MRIAILGAGAMGSWFGGRLALSGNDVQLLTTNLEHRDAINRGGLTLRTDVGETQIQVQADAPEKMRRGTELVVLQTKSFQSGAAMATVSDALDETTYVLTIQNGLGNAEAIAPYVPLDRVLIGVTIMPVDFIEPGCVAAAGHGATHFGGALQNGHAPTSDPMHARVLDTFTAASLEMHLDADIERRVWSKVAFNAGMNALSALSHGTPGSIEDAPGAKQLARDVAAETGAVGAACGVSIDLAQVYKTIDFACAEHGDHKPSMLQDLLRRRRTEVDALNGALVERGRLHGVPTPLNETLATLVRLAELAHERGDV
ncbi:MAG: 2-dehydropantoate 2-reductase [Chromatiales bacterium]|nr:2-dehydropantoate 2-reductase [Chromatiales bacterium]